MLLISSGCVAVNDRKEPINIQGKIIFEKPTKLSKNSQVTVGLLEVETKKVIYRYTKNINKNIIAYQISLNKREISQNKHYEIFAAITTGSSMKIKYANKYRQEVINNNIFRQITVMTEIENIKKLREKNNSKNNNKEDK